jgi:hypothetical protein
VAASPFGPQCVSKLRLKPLQRPKHPLSLSERPQPQLVRTWACGARDELTFLRTFATWANENGVSAKQRGELMGNSAEINASVYTQTTDAGLRRAVEGVGATLAASESTEQLFTSERTGN